MTDLNELDWLSLHRPAIPAPEEAATERARSLLLAAIDDEQTAAGAPTLSVVESPLSPSPIINALAPSTAEAKPLVRLSARVADLPTQPGDATLAQHTNVVASGQTFTGIDLYLDDGTYYFGTTAAELRQAADKQARVDDPVAAMMGAAAAAKAMPDAQARSTFLAAAKYPGDDVATGPAQLARAQRMRDEKLASLPASERAKVRQTQADAVKRPQLTATQRQDNYIWMDGMTALEAGGARSGVRAGVLHLFATLANVAVDQRTLDGKSVLRLRNSEFPDGYEETILLDASTGVMQQMTGGTAGQAPDVVVTYDVKRVTAADVLKG